MVFANFVLVVWLCCLCVLAFAVGLLCVLGWSSSSVTGRLSCLIIVFLVSLCGRTDRYTSSYCSELSSLFFLERWKKEGQLRSPVRRMRTTLKPAPHKVDQVRCRTLHTTGSHQPLKIRDCAKALPHATVSMRDQRRRHMMKKKKSCPEGLEVPLMLEPRRGGR